MIRLSVNVNKLATLRNSRGKNTPDVVAMARKILAYGAHGITVHPRPDGRHIRIPDVKAISSLVRHHNEQYPQTKAEFNVEGYPSDEFLRLIEEVKPSQCTMVVPDPPEALTSNAGWDLVACETALKKILTRLQPSGTRVSLFVDPSTFDENQQAALLRLKPHRIELYTEAYADAHAEVHAAAYENARSIAIIEEYIRAANIALAAGVGINAGHDLNQKNLGRLARTLPGLEEVSIGHALICEALEEGMETTIRAYLKILRSNALEWRVNSNNGRQP